MYTCEGCGKPVGPGEGYIHARHDESVWHVHHRDCAPDLLDSYCYGITESWSGVYEAHRNSRNLVAA